MKKKGNKEVVLSKFTPKQEAFCLEYLVDLNATQAAIRAGYAPNAARVTASKLLSKPNIQHQITKLNNTRIKETKVDVNFVLDTLHKLASSSVSEMFDEHGVLLNIKKMPEHIQKCIQAFEVDEEHLYADDGSIKVTTKTVRCRLWSKDKAIENLGKHLRLFTEKVELTNPDGNLKPEIIITLPSNNRENIV